VLLCGPCHRQIHEQRVTLQRNVDSLLRAASGPLPESWRESAPERSSPTQRPGDSLPSEVDQHTREPQGKRGTDDCVNPAFNDFTTSPAASGDAAGQLRPRNTAYWTARSAAEHETPIQRSRTSTTGGPKPQKGGTPT
jgi:hypothetical protein